jgi:competence protein ComEC
MQLIPVVLVATVAGSLLAPFYALPQTSGWLLLCACILFAVCWRKHSLPGKFFLLLIFFLLANLRYPLQFQTEEIVDQVDNLGKKITVTAELKKLQQVRDGRSQLDLQIISLRTESSELPAKPFLIRIFLGERAAGLLPGDRLRFKTRLRKPRLFGMPGEFHWPRYLVSQDIVMTGWLKSAKQLNVLDSSGGSPLRTLMAWREHVAKIIDLSVSPDQASLVRALTLGEARLLPEAVRNNMAHAGISHLFAISGLHLGLLGMLGYRLLLSLYRRSTTLLNWQPPQRVLPLFLLPLLLGYLLLTGDAISTRRAFCLAACAAGFWMWRYTVNPLRLLAALALLFLLLNPLLLWQPGWQLSFAGAAGILLWRPIWQDKTAGLPSLLRGPARLLTVTTAATLATLPLVISNFHLLAPAGLLANLLAVPLVALLALPIGLLGLIFSGWPAVAALCFTGCGFLLEFTVVLVEKLLAIPGFSGQYLFLSRWQSLALGLLMLPLLLVVQPAMKKNWRVFTGTSLLLVLLCACLPASGSPTQSLVMFSVGQGDSFLLTNAQQQAILIDGGGLYSDRFDVGKRLLAPALAELGIRRLSAVVLTHDHPDHRKGLGFVLRQFPVDEFWHGTESTDLHPDLLRVLLEKQIPLRQFPAGWSQAGLWGGDALHVFRQKDLGNKNDSSLVLYLDAEPGGVLLTGDLEKKGVTNLLASEIPGPVSLLKLPHHGSRYSGTEKLIKRLQPEICLVSAGYRNRYHFPAQQLVTFLHRSNIPLYRTDIMGTVRAQNNAGEWHFTHWRNGLFH